MSGRGGSKELEMNRKRFLPIKILATGLLLLWTFFPIYWMFTLALRKSSEWTQDLHFFPSTFTLDHFSELFRNGFAHVALNSMIITGISLVIALLTGAACAYILIRVRFRFGLRKPAFFWVLLVRILPPIAFAMPLYFIFNYLELSDTRVPLILAHLLINLPLIIWFVMSAIDNLAESIEESARIDGANEWQLFWHIILPQSYPALAGVGMLSFMASWNEYLYAVIFIQDPDLFTLPLKLSTMNSEQQLTQWGQIGAGGILSMIPVLIFVLFAQRYLIQGLSNGAVKE